MAANPAPSQGAMGAAVGASAGLDLLAGLFGFLGGQDGQAEANSRANMIRMEAEIDAQRFSEQAADFKARQKLAYLKSGVQLSGSPLDVLDETARVANENLSAIRARGKSEAFGMERAGLDVAQKGRAALIGGGFNAVKTVGLGMYKMKRDALTATTARNDTPTDAWRGVPYL